MSVAAPERVDLPVSGMTCAACARTIERKLGFTAGVIRASVNLQASQATVEYDDKLVKPDALANAVRQLGYEVPA